MLAIVEAHRPGGDVGLQGVLRVGQRRQGKRRTCLGHLSFPFVWLSPAHRASRLAFPRLTPSIPWPNGLQRCCPVARTTPYLLSLIWPTTSTWPSPAPTALPFSAWCHHCPHGSITHRIPLSLFFPYIPCVPWLFLPSPWRPWFLAGRSLFSFRMLHPCHLCRPWVQYLESVLSRCFGTPSSRSETHLKCPLVPLVPWW